MEYYNLDSIIVSLRKELSKSKTFLEAWEAVTFPTKKDGKPFAAMGKNIKGAKYEKEQFSLSGYSYSVTVSAWDKSNGYVSDSIKAYEQVRYIKDESMKAKTANYMPKESMIEQMYLYDVDDIKKAIARRIDNLREYIADLEKQIEKAGDVFLTYRNAYASAMVELQEATKEFSHKNLFYAVRDCVKDRYPYC